jgi:hypothetical protein
MTAKEFISRSHIASFENRSDTTPLQQAATSMTRDRMIVDNEDTGHLPALHYELTLSKPSIGSVFASLSWRLGTHFHDHRRCS